jgi:hypothetical protein
MSGLARAGHPRQALVIAFAAAVLGVKAGNTAIETVFLVGAVLSGQLLAGWAEDRMHYSEDRMCYSEDRRAEDRHAARLPKPLVTGALPLGVIETAIFATFVLTVFCSLLLGWRAGIVQLIMVACAVASAWRLRATPVGRLSYVVTGALLPAVATLALPDAVWPAWWVVVAGGLFGASVACADAIGAAAAQLPLDTVTTPARSGRQRTPLTQVPWPHGVLVPTATLLLVATAAVLALAAPRAPDAITVVGGVVAVVLIAAGARELWREPDSRATCFTVAALGPVFLIMLSSAGGTLH